MWLVVASVNASAAGECRKKRRRKAESHTDELLELHKKCEQAQEQTIAALQEHNRLMTDNFKLQEQIAHVQNLINVNCGHSALRRGGLEREVAWLPHVHAQETTKRHSSIHNYASCIACVQEAAQRRYALSNDTIRARPIALSLPVSQPSFLLCFVVCSCCRRALLTGSSVRS